MKWLMLCLMGAGVIWVSAIASAQDRGFATSIAWSPDGETIAIGSSTGGVWFFDTDFNEVAYVEVEPKFGPKFGGGRWTSPTSLAWNSAGNLLAVAFPVTGYGGNDIQIVDYDKLEVITSITVGMWKQQLWSQVVWHPRDDVIAAGGFWGKTLVWDAQTGEALFEFEESHEQISFPWNTTEAVCWISENVIAIATEFEIYVVDVDLNETLRSFDFGFPKVDRAWCLGDRRIFINRGELIDLDTGKLFDIYDQNRELIRITLFPHSLELGPSPNIVAVEFSPDGSKILTISEGCVIDVFDADNGRFLAQLPGGIYLLVGVEFAFLDSLSWHPDGSRFAAVGQFGGISVWDAETYELVRRYEGFEISYPATSALLLDSLDEEELELIDSLKKRCIEALSADPLEK